MRVLFLTAIVSILVFIHGIILYTNAESHVPFDFNSLPFQGDGNAILDSLLQLLKKNQGSVVLQQIATFPPDLQNIFDIAHCKARALAQVGRFVDSEDILQRLIQDVTVDPEDRRTARVTLAKILVALRRFPEAHTLLQSVLQQQDDNADAWLFLGKIYLQQAEPNIRRAKECMERAMQLNRQDERIAFEFAMILVQLGDAHGAREAFQLASSLNPTIDHKYLARIYLHLQRVDWAVGEFRLANTSYTDALEQSRNDPNTGNIPAIMDDDFYLMWADAEDHEGFATRAMDIFNYIIQQKNPRNALAYVGRACTFLGIGSGNHGAPYACGLHQDAALADLQQALELAENDRPLPPRAHEAINFCRNEANEVQSWRDIIDRDFANQDAKKTLFTTANKIAENMRKWDPAWLPVATRASSVAKERESTINDKNTHQPAAAAAAAEATEATSMLQRLLFDPILRFFFSSSPAPASTASSSSSNTPSQSSSSTSSRSSSGVNAKQVEAEAAGNKATSSAVEKTAAAAAAGTEASTRSLRYHSMRQNWEQRAKEMTALHRYDPLAVVELVIDASTTTASTNTSEDTANASSALYRNEITPRKLTFSQFYAEFMLQNRPAIITNFQGAWSTWLRRDRDAAAVRQAATSLLDELVSRYGNQFVRVSVTPTGRFDGPEAGSLWGIGEEHEEVLVRPPQTSMLLRDFVTLLQANSHGVLPETLYVEYLALHQYLGEQFTSHIPLPFSFQRPADNVAQTTSNNTHPPIVTLRPLVTNFWCSGGLTISPIHYDDYENFLTQMAGVKEITLFPPHLLPYLYYQGRVKGNMQYSYPNKFIRDALNSSTISNTATSSNNVAKTNKKAKKNSKNPLNPSSSTSSAQAKKVIFGSSIQLDRSPDVSLHQHHHQQKHALYVTEVLEKTSFPLRVVLLPGETLYLPAYWHHEVQSLPESMASSSFCDSNSPNPEDARVSTDVNMAINYWFQAVSTPINETALFRTATAAVTGAASAAVPLSGSTT